MTYNVAFMECTGDLWPEVAQIMQREHGWVPVYCSGAAHMQAELEARFPAVIFHENTEAIRGRPPRAGAPWDLPPLDDSLLSSLSYAELIDLSMMDRMDPDGSLDFHARTELYHRHLQIGLALLNRLRPDIVVFSSAPHLLYDYVIYQLCRLRQIPTVVFIETVVDGLVFSSPTIEGSSRELGAVYQRLRETEENAVLSATAEAHWQRLGGEFSKGVSPYIAELWSYQQQGRQQVPAEDEVVRRMAVLARRLARSSYRPRPISTLDNRVHSSGGRQIRRRIARIATNTRAFVFRHLIEPVRSKMYEVRDFFAAILIIRRLIVVLRQTGRANPSALYLAMVCTLHLYRAVETEFPLHLRCAEAAPTNYLKQFGVSAEDSELSYLEYWLYRLLALRKKRWLRSEYQRKVQPVDGSQPYVYVALHYQPEESTSPLGGFYVDQCLMVELLSKTVPDGWLIYVRENPFQFDKRGSGEMCRSFDFYRKLESFPNVRFVPTEASPFDLMDSAKAVATVTGTSGWEAVVRGVPTLAFGAAWYLACEGVFAVPNLENCRDALRKIAKGYRPDRRKVKLFLQTLERVGFRGYQTPDLRSAAGVTAMQNVTGFVEVLKRYQGKFGA